MRIVPENKFDDEACRNLQRASDDDIHPHLDSLLTWLQDINWPIAGPVAERLAKVGPELVPPLIRVLNSDDEIWKYWVVSHLLHRVRNDVFVQICFCLNRMKRTPTKSEIEEEVHTAVIHLLRARGL